MHQRHALTVQGGAFLYIACLKRLVYLHTVLSSRSPARVVVIEASQLLGSFDRRLRQYAANKLIKSGVTLRRGMVKEAFKDHVVLQVLATPCMLP